MQGARSKCVTRARAGRKINFRRQLREGDNLANDRCGVGLRATASNRKAGKFKKKIRSHSVEIMQDRKPQCYNAAAGVASACVARRAHKASLCDGPEDEEGAEVHEFGKDLRREENGMNSSSRMGRQG